MSDSRPKGGLTLSTALHLVLIILLGFLVYSNTFGAPFVLDDFPNIVQNPLINDFSSFFGDPSNAVVDPAVRWLFQHRTVGYFSFALNSVLHGLDPRGYHATNIVIHVINALLLYWLACLTFSTPALARTKFADNSRYIALFSALLFVCHPVHIQAVTYIVQRFASLAALFYLSSLTLYIKFRLRDTSGPKSVSIYVLALLSAVLAMKTKEIAFTLPLAITLYEFVFFKGLIRKRLLYLLPFFLSAMIIPISLMTADMPQEGIAYDTGEVLRLKTQMPRSDYLFTQFRVIPTYIRLLVFPINQTLDYDYPEFHALLTPQVFVSVLFLLSVLGLGVYLLHRSRTSEPNLRIVSFGIFWFFIALSVESSVVPIADVIFEHRAYLPDFGVSIAAATGAFLALDKLSNKTRPAGIALLASVVLALSAATYTRNTVWKSDITLWQDVITKAPDKARGYNNIAMAYQGRKMSEDAIRNFELAIQKAPGFALAHYNMGSILGQMGRLETAEEHLLEAVSIKPDYDRAHNNLGNVYLLKGELEKAVEQFSLAIKYQPDNFAARRNLASAYQQMGEFEKAMEQLRIADKFRQKKELR